MEIKFTIIYIIFTSVIIAQVSDATNLPELTFKVEKYKGNIDNSPITMLLTFYPDSSITGYYYYDKVGRLFKIKKSNDSKNFKLEAQQIELFNNGDKLKDTEIFEFQQNQFLNNKNLKGEWTYKGKTLPVNLTQEKLKFDWRLFEYKSTGYFNNSTFNEQTKDFEIIYPSITSSPKLNAYFLRENNFLNRSIIDFINSSNSNYLLIEQNFGDNTSGIDDCCWSDEGNNELVYISDSILTYRNFEYTYSYNAQYYTDLISLNIRTGQVYSANNIFKEEFIDTVLTLLRNKYKNVLQHEGTNYNNNEEAPLPTNYIKDSDIYIAKGGVYFRERLYKLANYYDLFLSYKEIKNYLGTSFKITIGLQ